MNGTQSGDINLDLIKLNRYIEWENSFKKTKPTQLRNILSNSE